MLIELKSRPYSLRDRNTELLSKLSISCAIDARERSQQLIRMRLRKSGNGASVPLPSRPIDAALDQLQLMIREMRQVRPALWRARVRLERCQAALVIPDHRDRSSGSAKRNARMRN